jgi:hypothetical protein
MIKGVGLNVNLLRNHLFLKIDRFRLAKIAIQCFLKIRLLKLQ